MTNAVDKAPSLSLGSFSDLMVTVRLNAGTAWNLVDDASRAGASDLAGLLALLDAQPAHAGDDSTTKLELLHSSVRDSMAAIRKVAELLGVGPE